MKKTLIALAALAAFGSASAQVTLYGKVDLGVSSTTSDMVNHSANAKKYGNKGTDQGMEVTSGNYESSRLGIKAATDLTGGIKAIAQYEMSLNAADYATAVTTDRVAMVGLTGSFGTLGLGLQWTPYDNAWGFDQMEYNGFSAPNKTWCKGIHCDVGNTSNGNAKKSISYTTPNISGFDATIMYANEGNKADAVGSTPAVEGGKYIGLGANYVAGPLAINAAWEQNTSSNMLAGTAGLTIPVTVATSPTVAGISTAGGDGQKANAYIIGASYNLGVATIGAGYQVATVDVTGVAVTSAGVPLGNAGTGQIKDSGYTLSVAVPVNAQTRIQASYAVETTTSDSFADGKYTGFGAQVIYDWTKQVAAYGGVYQVKGHDLGYTADAQTTKYAAGLRYNF